MSIPQKPPRATLGGIPIANAATVGWSMTAGVEPHTRLFVFNARDEDALAGIMGRPVELVIKPDEGDDLRWKNIYPLHFAPTTLPMHVAVLCSDVRWKWTREIVVRTYNKFRGTGSRRLVEGRVVELGIQKAEYRYVEGTLVNGRKWTPREMIEDVLREVARKCGHGWAVRTMPDSVGLSVENLELGMNAAAALSTALAHVPGAVVTIGRDGQALLLSAVAYQGTAEIIGRQVPSDAGGIPKNIILAALRPSEIRVWFDKEIELRFDSVEDNDAPSTSTGSAGDAPPMVMENVVMLPDPSTTINGVEYGQGSYVPMRSALAKWNEELGTLGKKITPPPLTIANVQRYWFVLETLYTPLGNLTLSAAQASWTARVAAIRAHYRKTYQIPYSWMKRIRALRPYRLGIHDPVNGTRAAAQTWSQYCVEPSPKAYVQAKIHGDKDLQFAWINVDNYPGFNADLWSKPASPAVVHVLDQDAGVLHIEYRTDPYEKRAAVHPSLMRVNGTGSLSSPTRDLADQLRGFMSIDGHVTGAARTWLSADFRVAILLTAMPLAPNDERRMLRYIVKPDDVEPKDAAGVQVIGGRGPAWNIIVPAGLLTAWFAHRQTVSARETCKRLFGFDDTQVVDEQDPPGYTILNLSGPDASIPAMAKALAIAQWSGLVDAVEGSGAYHGLSGLELVGNMGEMRWRLDPDGRIVTDIAMRSGRVPIDPLSLLSPAVRPWILRLPDTHV